jgi:hypothetical protein
MNKTRWFTLGAAAALFSASPALASEGHKHDPSHAHQGANAEAGKHGDAARADKAPAQPKPSYGKKAKGRTVEVTVTNEGFVPAEIPAKKGEVLNLVVTRKAEKTCADTIVQKQQKVNAPLPLDKPVTITMTAPKDGTPLVFACPHGHMTGKIVPQ